MALKFLNKKGWHTGSLRNIENVWKAEQKHDAEEKKLEELRKQIQEERERSEFRLLQEQAGLVPKQERLDFLYESGLAVGKNSDGFKALAPPPPAAAQAAEVSSSKAAVPGALFEDKPQSANDAWRKLHSDPLLLIRQREKEVLDRIKNNPMKMSMIRKSVEAEKKHTRDKKEQREKKERKGKHKSKHDKHSSRVRSDSEETSEDEKERREREHPTSERHRHKRLKHEKYSSDVCSDSEDSSEGEKRKKRDHLKHSKQARSDSKNTSRDEEERRKGHSSQARSDSKNTSRDEEERRKGDRTKSKHHEEERRNIDQSASKPSGTLTQDTGRGYGYNRHRGVPKLSEEERAARLREMQLDAELHEEQRWKRLKKAAEADAQEAIRASTSGGKNFLEAAQKSIYGTEKGGSSTIEESVRRRTYYSQGGKAAHESNAFRR